MNSSSEVRDIVARGTPSCSWCPERIQKGEIYKGWTWFGDGAPVKIKMHRECYAAMQRYFAERQESEFEMHVNTRGCTCEAGDRGHGTYPSCTPGTTLT
jgi:hypothetical protein